MAVKPSALGPKPQFELTDGLPAVGNKLFFYVAGSVNTKQDTYTDSTGLSANTNPIVLNSLGTPATEIWWTEGLAYKVVYAPSTDTDPPTSPIWSIDNLRGINDNSTTVDEWNASGVTPTYVSGTSFTLPGDQTSNFQIGRRLKFTVTAGTVYGRITASAYAALTTVTMQMDGSQVLDSGLSAVQLSILRNNVLSLPVRAATAAGTDTYTCSMGIARYVKDDEYQVYFTNQNATTTPTLNSDALGAKTIKLQDGTAVAAGQVKGACTLRYDGTDMLLLNPKAASVGLPPGFLFGCTISNNAGDAVNDLDITSGSCRDSTNTVNITCAAMTGKQLDVGWAPGSAAGLRNSGAAITNTTYHIYAVSKADGTQDYYAHTSTTVATVITALQAEAGGASYLYARRIGSIIRAGGTILGFKQSGDLFRLNDAPALDFTTANPGTSAVTWTIGGCPTGIVVEALVRFGYNNNNTYAAVVLSPLDSTDQAPSNTATPLGSGAHYGVASANTMILWEQVKTNTSAQIRYRVSFSSASTTAYGVGYGWRDDRGRSA